MEALGCIEVFSLIYFSDADGKKCVNLQVVGLH